MVRTAGGAALIGIGSLVSGLLGYIQTIAMTHMAARSVYGIFVVAFTAVTFASQITKIGLDGVVIRFLPAYRAKGERQLAAGLLRFTLWLPALVGVGCAAMLYMLSSWLARSVYHDKAYALPLKEIALLIPLAALQSMLVNSLRALKAIKWQVYVDKLIEPIGTLALLWVFYLLGLRLEAFILAYICGFGASTVAGWVLLRRAAQPLVRGAAPEFDPQTWMRFGAAMLFSVMTVTLVQSTDVLFLGAFAPPGQVSLYGVADRVATVIAMPFFALNLIFAPMIAEFHARAARARLTNMFALVTRWSFSLSWPVFLCCVIFREAILGVFGKGYPAAATALTIVAVGNLVNAGTGSVSSMLAMTGRLRILWLNMAARVTVNLALVFWLIPRYTVVGAAMASSFTVILLNIVGVVEVWWIMKIQPYRWDMLKPVVAGGVASVAGALLLRITRGGSGAPIVAAASLVLAFTLVYIFVLALLRLGEDDVVVFQAVRAKLGWA